MKVICIDDVWEDCEGYHTTNTEIKFGTILTVIEAFTDDSGSWYCFAEYDKDECFEQSAFAPLSNIDETELMEQRESNLQSL